MNYDVIIIGCGPAGLSTGIYCARANLKTLIIGNPNKSQLFFAHNIQNYFGIKSILGKSLLKKGINQAKNLGNKIIEQEVIDIKRIKDYFEIKTSENKKYTSKVIVIATGSNIKTANIKGEKEFLGKGIHTCVSCDGWFYNDKKVAVIGSKNLAANTALELTSHTKNISIITNSNKYEFSKEFESAIKKNKIKIIIDKIKEFKGKNRLEKIIGEKAEYIFDGCFIATGSASTNVFVEKLGLDVDENNKIKVNSNMETSTSNVFAVGNCTIGPEQIAKAVGDGAVAGSNIIKKLLNKKVYLDYS